MPGPGISGWSTSSSVLHAANRSSLLYQWHFWTAASNVFQVIIVKEENCSICTVPPRGQGKYQQAQNLKITKNTWAGLIQVIFYLRWKKYGKLSTVNEPSWPSVNWYKSVLSRKKKMTLCSGWCFLVNIGMFLKLSAAPKTQILEHILN